MEPTAGVIPLEYDCGHIEYEHVTGWSDAEIDRLIDFAASRPCQECFNAYISDDPDLDDDA